MRPDSRALTCWTHPSMPETWASTGFVGRDAIRAGAVGPARIARLRRLGLGTIGVAAGSSVWELAASWT